MTLVGVECARRRTSHGRSSVGFLQLPPLRRRSIPHPTAAYPPLRYLDPAGDQFQEVFDERATAARHRLYERLHTPTACTPYTISRLHIPPSISSPILEPRTNEKLLHRHNGFRVLNEEDLAPKLIMGGLEQDDCPVCLDSFLSGQKVIYLPCQHTFHSDCIVPWLQNHSHCPSCRAKIS